MLQKLEISIKIVDNSTWSNRTHMNYSYIKLPIGSGDSRLSSYDDVALKLLTDHPDVFLKTPLTDSERKKKVRSLATTIGLINKGKGDWWSRRKEATKCLADLLGINPDELGLNQKQRPHIFDFSDFRDLPALNLMLENGWKIAEPQLVYQKDDERRTLDSWLEPRGASPYNTGKFQVDWLYVADKLEYQLLTRKLVAVGRYEIFSRKSLGDIFSNDIELKRIHHQAPLILILKDKASVEDIEMLVRYRHDAPLLIISSWEPTFNELDKLGEGSSEKSIKINGWIWRFLPGWTELLSKWVEKRINDDKEAHDDTHFSSDGVKNLLDKFDSERILFDNVKDILVLCQAVHAEGKITTRIDSCSYDEKLFLSLFYSDEFIQNSLRTLMRRRWERWDLEWVGELAKEDWIDLAKGLPEKFDELLTKKLIVHGKTGFGFQSPIVMRLLLRNYLIEKIIKGELASWAPACFDSERRLLVDTALNAIPLDQLSELAEKLMQEPVASQSMGASEAIFIAIGRHIIKEKIIGSKLSAFAGHIIKQLESDEDDKNFVFPLSRRIEVQAEKFKWISVCWAWSLQSAPHAAIRDSWLFPGWSSSLPKELPQWLSPRLTTGNDSKKSREWLTKPMQEFLTVVTHWMETLDKPPFYKNTPSLFFIGLLACAAVGKWGADPSWWSHLISRPSAEQALLDFLKSADNHRTAALRLWPSLVQHLRTQPDHKAQSRNPKSAGYSAAVAWVVEKLVNNNQANNKQAQEALEALEALEDVDRYFLVRNPAALPLPFKKELLKWLVKNVPPDWDSWVFSSIFLSYGSEMATEIEAFLGHEKSGKHAASYLWEWAPHIAKSLFESKVLPPEATENLILKCPASALGSAIKLLKNDPQLLQQKRLEWVRLHLPDSRQHAQELMEFIKTVVSEKK